MKCDSPETDLMLADDGCLWLDRRWREPLARAGLERFGQVMHGSEGHCLRAMADRENWWLQLPAADPEANRFYLKKHHVRTWESRVRARLGKGPGQTAAGIEARNIRRLAREGIDTMRLVAFGQRLDKNGTVESLVMTEELTGFEPLDDFVIRRFTGGPLDRTRPRRAADDELRTLIRRVAELVSRFHAAGYNHRDLYCCHLFVREPRPGRFELRLIDLQRVEHRRRWRRRWIVKDLAQLAYSAPRGRIKAAHKMAFLRDYLGVTKLGPREKRFIRRVVAKQQRMERKKGLYR
ncbi:MAG: hypothetical protein JW719_04355 [Pirellulales bacterium]|nr:hypothetical protein [Pirellulales bacterium]